MTKKELRRIYRDKRAAIDAAEASRMDDLLLIRFQALDLPFLHRILSYWPIEENNEPNTQLVTGYLRFRNPEIAIGYPVSDFEKGTMTALQVDIDTAFHKTQHNVFEPERGIPMVAEELELVIVPMVICDRLGYRVGYGKGFYDRFLADCNPGCIKVGLSYFEPVTAISDLHEFDIPLDICITPHNTYVF